MSNIQNLVSFLVTIRATVTKTMTVTAATQQAAEEQAHQDFTTDCEGPFETYKQETLDSVQVPTVQVLPLQVRETAPLQWVVVDNPGLVDETVIDDFSRFELACGFIAKRGQGGVMKRLPDGSLTTEF
jgi:hypothetical protein